MKLQLGTGPFNLPGWINTDIMPGPNQEWCDVTARFPYADALFTHVYAEQLIEHLTYADGLHMLRECHRVLAPGGRIRLTTPDLSTLCRLDLGAVESEFAMMHHIHNSERLPSASPCHILNAFFTCWGHRFIYDADTLSDVLELCGFTFVGSFAIDRSPDPVFCNIEQHWKTWSKEMDAACTMYLEGSKP